MSYEDAIAYSKGDNSATGVCFYIRADDPYFMIDIDDCLIDGQWSPFALDLCKRFAGAHIEVSDGGKGLHIFGTSSIIPAHSCKNKNVGGCSILECYSHSKPAFVTDRQANGSTDKDCTQAFQQFVAEFFPARPSLIDGARADDWNGPDDDDELLGLIFASNSKRAQLGGTASFADLWENRIDALAQYYPAATEGKAYDQSSADAALAQHLAFWTGRDPKRMERLMLKSALVRDKWEGHSGYLEMTIGNACNMCTDVYKRAEPKPVESVSACSESASPEPIVKEGVQYLASTQQAEYFAGCVYVRDANQIMVPGGDFLKREQFSAYYGGYLFQMTADGSGAKTDAWMAFTQSQCFTFPKVHTAEFRPDMEPGHIYRNGSQIIVNQYFPEPVKSVEGDPTPFLNHLAKILPDEGDRDIILYYMASVVQFKGLKFQWCPVIQGMEGNGKTIVAEVIERAVGPKHCHRPQSQDIGNRFNGWMQGVVFVYIDELKVPEHKAAMVEVMKTLVTSSRSSVQRKRQDQIMKDIVANGLATTNYKDALPIVRDGRRYAIFYTAQQTEADLIRDGMSESGGYFHRLWGWLNSKGFAIMTNYLQNLAIPNEFKQTLMHRAPKTSSTNDALVETLGAVEQRILEAIADGRTGFRYPWVSSIALATLLQEMGRSASIPFNRRRTMMDSIGYTPHPALPEGRLSQPSIVDGGKRPLVYVKAEASEAHVLTTPKDVVTAYVSSQQGLNAQVRNDVTSNSSHLPSIKTLGG